MSDQHLKPTWYEISIGWQDGKSWFLVDRMVPELGTHTSIPGFEKQPRQESVEVKTVNGSTSEITIQATFSHLPTLEDAMKVVLAQTHTDLSGEVKYHLTSRKEGLATAARPIREDLDRELKRMMQCVPDPATLAKDVPR